MNKNKKQLRTAFKYVRITRNKNNNIKRMKKDNLPILQVHGSLSKKKIRRVPRTYIHYASYNKYKQSI